MALQKDYELPSGVIANYLRVNQLEIDKVINNAKVYVGVYKDSEARVAGKLPLQSLVFHIEGSQCSEIVVGNNLIALVYGWLKLRPEFEGSIDC